MQKKKKKTKLFIFLIICFVLVPFLLTKGCNYMESLNQAENSLSEPISSISEQIEPSARVYTHAHTHARTHSRPHYVGAYAHERAHTRTHNAHEYAQAHSISKANWTGTAVPNTGYVENVYFNTNLTKEEVVTILDSLNDFENYMVLVGEDMFTGIQIVKHATIGWYDMAYFDAEGPHVIFSSVTDNSTTHGSGWVENLGYNFIGINKNVLNEAMGMVIGAENNKLKNLYSITPFEQSSNNNELSIGNLFTQLGNAVIIFGGAVVNVFISMEPIFWNEGPTLIFILLIASVSFGLVFWGIELLISLIGVFKTKRKKKK